MIGTLVGLVAMLGNMADPKAIGLMAVALLTNIWSYASERYIFANENYLRQNAKEVV